MGSGKLVESVLRCSYDWCSDLGIKRVAAGFVEYKNMKGH